MPTVSAIIPAYNAAPFIERTVASALNQRDCTPQVIVVDDGSTDGTWESLERFGDAIIRVRQDNGGPARARNHGASLSSGEWLAFLDADDEWMPEKLSRQLEFARDDVSLIYTDRINFGAIDRVAERYFGAMDRVAGRQLSRELRQTAEVFDYLLLENFITTSSVLIRKSTFQSLAGFAQEPEPCEDWDLWLRFVLAGGKIAHCPEPLTRYRLHDSSVSSNQARMHRGRMTTLRRAFAKAQGRRVNATIIRQAWANAWASSAWSVAGRKPWTALGWYARAATYRPFNAAVYKEMVKCLLWMA